MSVQGYQESMHSGSRIASLAHLAGEAVAAALFRLDEAVGRWQTRVHDRRVLGQLDDRLLGDIGLSRYDVEGEVKKPFWRG